MENFGNLLNWGGGVDNLMLDVLDELVVYENNLVLL